MHPTLTIDYLASQAFSENFEERFWKKINNNGPIPEHMSHLGNCWLWTGKKNHYGYGVFCKNKHRDEIMAQRMSWIIHAGPIPKGLCVLHHCDCRLCCRFDHLWIGTRPQNTQDMINKGRMIVGENHPSSRVTEAQVIEIKRLRKEGHKVVSIAEKFGVTHTNICKICLGKTWKHI